MPRSRRAALAGDVRFLRVDSLWEVGGFSRCARGGTAPPRALNDCYVFFCSSAFVVEDSRALVSRVDVCVKRVWRTVLNRLSDAERARGRVDWVELNRSQQHTHDADC